MSDPMNPIDVYAVAASMSLTPPTLDSAKEDQNAQVAVGDMIVELLDENATLRKENANLRQIISDLIPCMDKAFDFDGDVFRLMHNDAVDALLAARAALGETK